METGMAALEQAFRDYRSDLEACEKKSRPTDGLLGFGRSIKDDPCHERFDERVREAVDALLAEAPSPEEARRAAQALLLREDAADWPLSAQWMFRAAERHALALIPRLRPADAAGLLQAYGSRYRRWDRLPAQQELYRALKRRAAEAGAE